MIDFFDKKPKYITYDYLYLYLYLGLHVYLCFHGIFHL